jgi:hypothetical protein
MQLTSFSQFLSYTSKAIQLQYQILAEKKRNIVPVFISVSVPVIPSIVQKQYCHILKKKRITENLDTMIMHELGVHKINPHKQYDN